MTKPIRGKIAQIFSGYELAINIGTAHGVTDGMVFDIIETRQIKDPDTAEVLGKVERSKGVLEVIEAQERLSVVQADDPIVLGNVGPFASSLLSSKGSLVRIGDIVVERL